MVNDAEQTLQAIVRQRAARWQLESGGARIVDRSARPRWNDFFVIREPVAASRPG
jgi:hypothetical protein